MKHHPGGCEYTEKLLMKAGFSAGDRVLDMGAGEGKSLELMRKMDLKCMGIDLEPRGDEVQKGNLLASGFESSSFDGVLAECSFYVSGDRLGALKEAHRLLKTGGKLVLSDVFFEDALEMLEETGFMIFYEEDLTQLWKEYYIEALWRGDEMCQCSFKGKCRYLSLICEKKK